MKQKPRHTVAMSGVSSLICDICTTCPFESVPAGDGCSCSGVLGLACMCFALKTLAVHLLQKRNAPSTPHSAVVLSWHDAV